MNTHQREQITIVLDLVHIYDGRMKLSICVNTGKITLNQGNLKGESAVAAILLSRMEGEFCTSGFCPC